MTVLGALQTLERVSFLRRAVRAAERAFLRVQRVRRLQRRTVTVTVTITISASAPSLRLRLRLLSHPSCEVRNL